MHFQQLKEGCSALKLYFKGVPFVNKMYTKGVPFLSKMVYKSVMFDLGEEPSLIKFVEHSPHEGFRIISFLP